jgi:uncharacterized protein (DUF885 family)
MPAQPASYATMTDVVSTSEVADRYVDEFAALDPVSALTGMGMGINTARLTDFSPEGTAAIRDLLAGTARTLRAATVETEAERLGAIYLGSLLQARLDLIDSGEQERTMSILSGPPSAIRMTFDLADPRTTDDWEAIALRLQAVPAAISGYQASLEAGLAAGRIASRRCVEAVAQQCRVWSGADNRGWFTDYAASRRDAPFADRLLEGGRGADQAYGRLAEWLEAEYLQRADGSDGVGEEAYQLWAKHFLGARLDLDEAYQWGWEELARLEAEQAAECGRIRPGESFLAVQEHLNTDPGRAKHGVDEWRSWLQDLTDTAIEDLDGRHFDIAPVVRTCTVTMPPEGSAAAPYYTPPSDDLSRPGRIWFPVMGRTSFPTWDGVTTVFHEAVPGHHLQFGASRLVELTRVQKLGFNSAHGEGWALYAERLMDELGKFDRPDYRLGFISMQAFRAARVVVDIGLHTARPIAGGRDGAGSPWDYERAVEFLIRASGLTRPFCESEVIRYLSWPSQATSYKLGERVWLAGRDLARRRDPAGFDLKQWHSASLSLGPLGLDDLAGELRRIATA